MKSAFAIGCGVSHLNHTIGRGGLEMTTKSQNALINSTENKHGGPILVTVMKMSCKNTVSNRKRGPYRLKEAKALYYEGSILQDHEKTKYYRRPYHDVSGDSETKKAKLKRGPYLKNTTEPIAKQQLSASHCELRQEQHASSDFSATIWDFETMEELRGEGDKDRCLQEEDISLSLPEFENVGTLTETDDLDQNSTMSESDVDLDFEFCDDSDLDGEYSEPCGVISPPLYQLPPSSVPHTAPITKAEHLTMVISYALKHCLTYQAFQDLLNLISLHCPQPSFCELSVFKAKASFVAIEDKIIYHDYCDSCFLLFSGAEVVCQNCIKEDNGGKIR